MTISVNRRLEDQDTILTYMLSRTKDNELLEQSFVSVDDLMFTAVAPTAFLELVEQDLAERRRILGVNPQFFLTLTNTGWLDALDRTGELNSPVARERALPDQ